MPSEIQKCCRNFPEADRRVHSFTPRVKKGFAKLPTMEHPETNRPNSHLTFSHYVILFDQCVVIYMP